MIRVDPETGEGLPDNPRASSSDPDTRRIIAYGLRNPFRMTIRPGTNEPWVGDVGWAHWEEINRADAAAERARELRLALLRGQRAPADYDALDLNLCEFVYAATSTSGRTTRTTTRQGLLRGVVPDGQLVDRRPGVHPPGQPVAGRVRRRRVLHRLLARLHLGDGGAAPLPNNARRRAFRTGAGGPVNLQFGPGGDLFYPDFNAGTVKRIHYSAGNQAPRAVVSATPTNGSTPLQVDFSATGSSDPDPGDTITYDWDLDGDGAYDDATGSTAQHTYTDAGRYLAGVRVTDNHGA